MSRAIEAVKRIYKECGLSDPLDIPIETVISSKNIIINEAPIEGSEGRILIHGDSAIITVNSSIDFLPKKRFILAHELGHFELHKNSATVFSDDDETLNHSSQYNFNQREVEANEFAAEYLMPTELFNRECQGKIFNHTVISHLASRFQVSKTAAILKFLLKGNGNHPIFVVCCQDNKMKWFKKSDDWRYYSLFNRGGQPPEGSVAREVFEKGIGYYGEDASQQIWKSDWFVVKDDEIDSPFFEYCLFVPSLNYMISVIWEK